MCGTAFAVYDRDDVTGEWKRLEIQQVRDKIKNKFCKENNIKLIRIPYWKKNNINIILDNLLVKGGQSVS